MWDGIVLTDSEERVLRAIRIVDPRIERIAAVERNSYRDSPARGGFKVRLAGTDLPLPIGSLGDGTWRLLAMAIALSRAGTGVLLIDEIDTGLHYTVMEKMWELIKQTAEELEIQVFATTHSSDCVSSLASICRADVTDGSDVTIQRIEPEREDAVRFTEAEISVAADRHIEVR